MDCSTPGSFPTMKTRSSTMACSQTAFANRLTPAIPVGKQTNTIINAELRRTTLPYLRGLGLARSQKRDRNAHQGFALFVALIHRPYARWSWPNLR